MSEPTDLFSRLGGTRAMADLIGEPPSTVQSWKAAGRIPAQKQPLVIEKAGEAGFDVTAEDVVWPMGRELVPVIDQPADTASQAAMA